MYRKSIGCMFCFIVGLLLMCTSSVANDEVSDREAQKQKILAKLEEARKHYKKEPRKKFSRFGEVPNYADSISTRIIEVGSGLMKENQIQDIGQVKVMVTIEVDKDGNLFNAFIHERDVDKRAKSLILNALSEAAPFPKFPDSEYFADTDILVLTRFVTLNLNHQEKFGDDCYFCG